MAAIGVTMNNEGLATITLDTFEWTKFYVNDQPVSGGKYVQPTAGTLTFRAYATNYLVPVNDSFKMELKIQDADKPKTGVFIFSALSLADGSTLCTGLMTVENGYSKNAQDGPISFSEGRMTGLFSYVS